MSIKKVYRIILKLMLKSLKRDKRKYLSYKGTVDNLNGKDFNVDKTNKKWYINITEINFRGEKYYLFSILDGYNRGTVFENSSK